MPATSSSSLWRPLRRCVGAISITSLPTAHVNAMEFADEVSHGPTACRPRRRCPQILEIGKTIEPVHTGAFHIEKINAPAEYGAGLNDLWMPWLISVWPPRLLFGRLFRARLQRAGRPLAGGGVVHGSSTQFGQTRRSPRFMVSSGTSFATPRARLLRR
jgi:hypothetical protein